MLRRILIFSFFALCTVWLTSSARSEDGNALLGSSAKMGSPAGWNDRKATVAIETFSEDDKVRRRSAETQERLGEDLKISALTEFKSPSDVRGLRVLDIWSPEDEGDAWAWTPYSERFQRIPSGQSDEGTGYGNEPGYRYAQLLDLLPRMSEYVEAKIVGGETIDDDIETTVVDVDVGDRTWPLGRKFRVWISKDDELIRRIESWGPDGVPSRRVSVLTYSEADGRTTATKVAIQNLADERKSVFVRTEVAYDRGIPERTFSLQGVSKGR